MVCGVPPRGLITAVSRPHPFFSFFGKRKEGGEKKKQGQQTRRKRTRRIFSVLSTQECDRAQGRFSSQHRLSAEKRVLSPRYKRADARSILGRSPKLYNRVWSPRLKTASPINQNKIIPRLRLPSTDPVWARRFKPTRPAETERPPLSFGTPHAVQPLESWSPDFSVRVVTQTRGGAGSKQNGLPHGY